MAAFADRVALVTGGASGIGLATAERFAKEGARVVVGDLPGGAARAQAVGAAFVELAVASPDAWRHAVADLTGRHGGLDLVYLNAGIMTLPATERGVARVDLATLPLADYRRVMGVNVDGVVFGIQAAIPALEARGGGAIVVTASLAGLVGFAPDAIYSGTKHFVIGLVRSLAGPLAKRNITLNAVCPGGVDTQILGAGAERLRASGAQLMDPAQIADGVVRAIAEGGSGNAYMCQLGRDHETYAFAPIPGL